MLWKRKRKKMKLANYKDPLAIQWYKALNVHQRLTIKTECNCLVGMAFEEMRVLFSTLEIISILYNKLITEGIIQPFQPLSVMK
jgi:hypothetical protein